MMSPNPQEPDPLDIDPEEERIGELINEFFDRRQRGEAISEKAFLAEHPEHADALREHLAGLNLIAGMGSSGGGESTVARDAPTGPRGSSSVDPFEAAKAPRPDIPGYDIHKLIGRGGMGLVYKAMQVSTRRVVALKVLLEGPFAADQSRKRFQREVALAAQLRHANIIPIYDSGEHDGRMYYAMEHVYGLPLNEYIHANPLKLRDKLHLFARICDAVGHAHQRGVIHRDLKPSNILVDGDGEPHILDFGLAKAGGLGDMTTSITAQIVGTPAYMSPEQAAGDPTGIDTRTDIYSLGVILYEILTRRMPYETNVAIGQVLHHIAHTEPTPPNRIDPKVGGELALITMKALEKRKENRYQSVDAFVADIRHFLAGEPISARPASTFYLLTKAAGRHKVAVIIGALVIAFGALTGGVVGYFSTRIKQKEVEKQELAQRADEQEQALLSSEEERERHVAGKELLRQFDPVAAQKIEAAERAFDLLKQHARTPEQKAVSDILTELGAGLGRKEAPPALIGRMAAAALDNLAPTTQSATPAEPERIISGYEERPQGPSQVDITPELISVLKILTGQSDAAPNPTTRPAGSGSPARATNPTPAAEATAKDAPNAARAQDTPAQDASPTNSNDEPEVADPTANLSSDSV